MRLTFERVPRLPRWPRWAVAVAAAWLGLVGLAGLLAPGAVLCGFRRLTGIPCPSCGLTRGVTALLHGDVAGALACNPLLLAALLLLLAAAALRVILGVAPRIRITRAGLAIAVLLVALNWAYVIRRDLRPPEPPRMKTERGARS